MDPTLLLMLRTLLAGVFVVAGVAKLADPEGSRQAVTDFGVPERWAGWAARLLPVCELLVAGLLLVTATARIGAVGAMGLLATFAVVIIRSLQAGEAPACRCFGQVHSEPVGRTTLVRNGVLAFAAAVVLVGGAGRSLAPAEVPGWVAAACGVLAFGAVVALLAVRRAPTVTPAPVSAAAVVADATRPPADALADLTAIDRHGARHALAELVPAGRPTILAFTAPGCGPCKVLVPKLRVWQRSLADEIEIQVLVWGKVADLPEDGDDRTWAIGRDAFDALGLTETPSALLVGADGALDEAIAGGPEAIEVLVRRAVRSAAVVV